MGYILEQAPEMGEYSGEVRRESFYLRGEHGYEQIGTVRCPSDCNVIGPHEHADYGYVDKRHALVVYPESEGRHQGTVEILLEDIPKIRAVLDAVEAHALARR
jgi:hypothetical protein